jgi:hypothetical protein
MGAGLNQERGRAQRADTDLGRSNDINRER